ncbi:hypothetical protein PR048_007742 [Dryococelus australis]|uniref:Uncharacterized protein n=1 Tax=Dryococelus australis TaxID=614101 RepID=A0ABQ9HV36_9NEOP|nr:hypothetical protein PR048_007742 [Dryococelus australis]
MVTVASAGQNRSSQSPNQTRPRIQYGAGRFSLQSHHYITSKVIRDGANFSEKQDQFHRVRSSSSRKSANGRSRDFPLPSGPPGVESRTGKLDGDELSRCALELWLAYFSLCSCWGRQLVLELVHLRAIIQVASSYCRSLPNFIHGTIFFGHAPMALMRIQRVATVRQLARFRHWRRQAYRCRSTSTKARLTDAPSHPSVGHPLGRRPVKSPCEVYFPPTQRLTRTPGRRGICTTPAPRHVFLFDPSGDDGRPLSPRSYRTLRPRRCRRLLRGRRSERLLLSAGFPVVLAFPTPLHSAAAAYSPHFTPTGIQDLTTATCHPRLPRAESLQSVSRLGPCMSAAEDTRGLRDDQRARLYSLMYKYADINCTLVVCCHSGRRRLGQHSPGDVKHRVHQWLTVYESLTRFPAGSLLDFRMWESCRADAAGQRVFSGISRFSSLCIPAPLHTHLSPTLIGSQDLDILYLDDDVLFVSRWRLLPKKSGDNRDTSQPAALQRSGVALGAVQECTRAGCRVRTRVTGLGVVPRLAPARVPLRHEIRTTLRKVCRQRFYLADTIQALGKRHRPPPLLNSIRHEAESLVNKFKTPEVLRGRWRPLPAPTLGILLSQWTVFPHSLAPSHKCPTGRSREKDNDGLSSYANLPPHHLGIHRSSWEFCRTTRSSPRPVLPPDGYRRVVVRKTVEGAGGGGVNIYSFPTRIAGRGGDVVRLLASHLGEPGSIPGMVAPGFSHVGTVPNMPLVGGFPGGSPVSPALSFRRCSILTSVTLVDSQDFAVKGRPNHSFSLPP